MGMVVVAVMAATPGHAQDPEPGEACGDGAAPVVSIRFDEDAFPPAFRAQVLRDLRGGLAPGGIAACSAEQAAEAGATPAAEIRVAAGPEATVGVVIDVADAVTRKRVGRDVDLEGLPADGRAFAVALAADELLRASWAELALVRRGGDEDAGDAPAAVRGLVDESLAEPSAPPGDVVGGVFAFERYTTGAILFGGDAFIRHYLGERLGLELAFGYRVADEASGDRGTVDTRAFALGARLAVPLISRRPGHVEVELVAGVDGRVVTFTGRPADGARGTERTAVALFGRAGLRLAIGLGRVLRLELAGGLGVPFLAQNATDDRGTVTGLADLETWATLALAFAF